MTENECLAKMVAPGTRRLGKYREGVIQIMVTRACDQACFNCTQGSNLAGKPVMMTLDEFQTACRSLRGYWGVVGMFGGNPAMHPQFEELCCIMRDEVPAEQRGLWCNNPLTLDKSRIMAQTFDPSVSNLNVHMDRHAYDLFKAGWPESRPFGLDSDSRHSPPFVAMKDVIPDEGRRWELISDCDINKHWSALIGAVPGRGLRAYFCEIAYAQAALHADDPEWPDTGLNLSYPNWDYPGAKKWWQLPMRSFDHQVRQHCHNCGVPLRRYGQLAVGGDHEEVSKAHADIYRPKVKGRSVELVTTGSQPVQTLGTMTDYMGNAKR